MRYTARAVPNNARIATLTGSGKVGHAATIRCRLASSPSGSESDGPSGDSVQRPCAALAESDANVDICNS